MEIKDGATAQEWLNAWGDKAFTLNRAKRTADDLDRARGLCRDRQGETYRGLTEAVEVLRDAVARNEAKRGA